MAKQGLSRRQGFVVITVGALAALLSSVHVQALSLPGGTADTVAGLGSAQFATPSAGTANPSLCPLVRLLPRRQEW